MDKFQFISDKDIDKKDKFEMDLFESIKSTGFKQANMELMNDSEISFLVCSAMLTSYRKGKEFAELHINEGEKHGN